MRVREWVADARRYCGLENPHEGPLQWLQQELANRELKIERIHRRAGACLFPWTRELRVLQSDCRAISDAIAKLDAQKRQRTKR